MPGPMWNPALASGMMGGSVQGQVRPPPGAPPPPPPPRFPPAPIDSGKPDLLVMTYEEYVEAFEKAKGKKSEENPATDENQGEVRLVKMTARVFIALCGSDVLSILLRSLPCRWHHSNSRGDEDDDRGAVS